MQLGTGSQDDEQTPQPAEDLEGLVNARSIRRDGADAPELRASRLSSAAASIGPVVPGINLYLLTFGQFDIADVIEHLLNGTGPAEVTCATWTAGAADLERAEKLLRSDRITSMRWILDQSFPSRQPAYFRKLIERFGQDSAVLTNSHAKFVLIKADGCRLVVRTSANLNANKRLENVEVSDDPALFDFMDQVVADIFAEGDSIRPPVLSTVPMIEAPVTVRVGAAPRVGA